MAIKRRAELIATSSADELSLRALADIAEITVDKDVRIIGGQMTSLLLTSFPVPGLTSRRTNDADTAITPELAGSGVLHDRLLERGYIATSGNNYRKPMPELATSEGPAPDLSVDLLVPSRDDQFRPSVHGDRSFDSAPGILIAFAANPITIDAAATLLDGTVLEFSTRVPTVEIALVIKAHAYASRRENRDVEDIYRLLEIAETYPAEEIGGWSLNADKLLGSRKDSAVRLHELASRTRRLFSVDFPPARLAALIASKVTRP